ncbi:MAG: GNAT family N-acetyltransferase [Myxococcales bacterium]|nr:MAG: GNAT family N-acetyltransferase [Myxococcales bacterium]
MDDLSVIRLDAEADWEAVRGRLLALEAAADPDVYANWAFQRAVWRAQADGRPAYLAVQEDTSGWRGAAFFMAAKEKRGGLPVTVLRSLDFAVMKMAPSIARRGEAAAFAETLAAHRATLRRKTGASLVSLHKLAAPSAAPLVAALARQGVPHRVAPFNKSYQVALTDDFEAYWQTKARKSRYNIRRSARLLEEELGAPPSILRARGERSESKNFDDLWRRFKELRAQSWQMQTAVETDPRYAERLESFFTDAMNDWGRRGWLDLSLLVCGERVVAGQINAVTDGVQWVILLAYDQSLARLSPGRVLMWMQLEDGHARGDRAAVLGGASEEGKAFWANSIETTLTVEWSLGGLSGASWALRQRLKRRP